MIQPPGPDPYKAVSGYYFWNVILVIVKLQFDHNAISRLCHWQRVICDQSCPIAIALLGSQKKMKIRYIPYHGACHVVLINLISSPSGVYSTYHINYVVLDMINAVYHFK